MSIEVYPVVHITHSELAVEQAVIALDEGADGVYLIDHHMPTVGRLLQAYNNVRSERPEAFIGVNFLQCADAYAGFNVLRHAFAEGEIGTFPNGLWNDDARKRMRRTDELRQDYPELLQVLYLGGAAFKYTSYFTDEPGEAAIEAVYVKDFVDVVTTSGAGTGMATNPDKIIAMKRAIGDVPLAIASGIDSDNIQDFFVADQVLVASSVETEKGSGIFDTDKLKKLIELAHR